MRTLTQYIDGRCLGLEIGTDTATPLTIVPSALEGNRILMEDLSMDERWVTVSRFSA